MIDEDTPDQACSIGGCPSVTEICSYSMSCPSATEHGDGVIVVGTIAAGLAQQVRRADGRILSETIAPNETAVLIPSSLLSELPEMVRLRERVAKLEARLEIDREFVMGDDGVMVGVEIAAEDRDKASDGIECRDATIRLQDEHIVKLKAELAAQTRITEACHRSMKEMLEVIERLKVLLSGRDKFLVDRELWLDFVATLPEGKSSSPQAEEKA